MADCSRPSVVVFKPITFCSLANEASSLNILQETLYCDYIISTLPFDDTMMSSRCPLPIPWSLKKIDTYRRRALDRVCSAHHPCERMNRESQQLSPVSIGTHPDRTSDTSTYPQADLNRRQSALMKSTRSLDVHFEHEFR